MMNFLKKAIPYGLCILLGIALYPFVTTAISAVSKEVRSSTLREQDKILPEKPVAFVLSYLHAYDDGNDLKMDYMESEDFQKHVGVTNPRLPIPEGTMKILDIEVLSQTQQKAEISVSYSYDAAESGGEVWRVYTLIKKQDRWYIDHCSN